MSKKLITVKLKLSEIVYDVQNKTYLTGRSRDTGQNYEEVAHMQASDDDENGNQILRSISTAWNNLKTEFAEYLEESTVLTHNILMESDKDLSLTLKMPSNYNQASAGNIGTSLHSYIVNYSVAEWFNITNKSDAADYVQMAARDLEQARKALSKRARPLRESVQRTEFEVLEGELAPGQDLKVP